MILEGKNERFWWFDGGIRLGTLNMNITLYLFKLIHFRAYLNSSFWKKLAEAEVYGLGEKRKG